VEQGRGEPENCSEGGGREEQSGRAGERDGGHLPSEYKTPHHTTPHIYIPYRYRNPTIRRSGCSLPPRPAPEPSLTSHTSMPPGAASSWAITPGPKKDWNLGRKFCARGVRACSVHVGVCRMRVRVWGCNNNNKIKLAPHLGCNAPAVPQ
jgi:hypothetical protein